MKSFVLVIAFIALPHLASAKNFVCATNDAGTYAVVFSHLNQSEPVVTLTTRVGDAERSYSGSCQYDQGAIETAVTCDVPTRSEGTYIVRIFSIGSGTLYASVEGGILFQALDLGVCGQVGSKAFPSAY